MAAVRFLDKDGTFTLDKAENYSYLYLPVANEKGLKAAVTPVFGGDSKVDQNTFLMEPVSAENLHNNRSTHQECVLIHFGISAKNRCHCCF